MLINHNQIIITKIRVFEAKENSKDIKMKSIYLIKLNTENLIDHEVDK
jgi:hypothetical protein